MNYKEQFSKLVESNRLEEARIVIEKLKYSFDDDPFYYDNLGWLLNHMEHYMEADFVLRKGISIFPMDPWLYGQLGFCLNRKGDINQGIRMLQHAISLGFEEAWAYGELGWCYKEKKDFHKAILYFEDGLMIDEKNIFILSQAAHAYLQIEDIATAQLYFKKCYQYAPTLDSLYDIAYFYHVTKNEEKELYYLLQINQKCQDPDTQLEIATLYQKRACYKEAYTYLQQVLASGRDDTSIRNMLGDVCLLLQDEQQAKQHFHIALQYYEKAIPHEVDAYWLYQEMIFIAHKLNDTSLELRYLDQASKDHEMTYWLMLHYAHCYSALEQFDQAADACEYCLLHGEKDKEILNLYAWNLSRCHREKEAITILNQSVQLDAKDGWVYGELGRNYVQTKEYVKAKYYFEKALIYDDQNILYTHLLGWCCLQLAALEDAQYYVEKALTLGGEEGALHFTLAQIWEQKKEYKRALQAYKVALKRKYEIVQTKEKISEVKQLMNSAAKK